MLRYIITRTIWIFIVLLVILSVNFWLIKLAPEYPPATEEERDIYYSKQVDDGYMTRVLIRDEEEMEKIRHQVRTDTRIKGSYYVDHGHEIRGFEPVPISVQYVNWLKNIARGDWGLSTRIAVGRPAFDLVKERIPVTLRINLVALVIFIPIGITLGTIAALNKDKLIDNIISLGVMVMISVPSFVIILLLLMIFGYQLGWVPTRFPASDADFLLRVQGLILPVTASVFGPIAGLTRLTRAELTEVMTSEFLLLARTKGLTRRQSITRHAMRNSMVPLVPSIIFAFVGILSGSVILEQIYSIPGTGRIALRALMQRDYNVMLVSTAFYTSIGLVAILIVDLSYGLVDPRIRMGGRK